MLLIHKGCGGDVRIVESAPPTTNLEGSVWLVCTGCGLRESVTEELRDARFIPR